MSSQLEIVHSSRGKPLYFMVLDSSALGQQFVAVLLAYYPNANQLNADGTGPFPTTSFNLIIAAHGNPDEPGNRKYVIFFYFECSQHSLYNQDASLPINRDALMRKIATKLDNGHTVGVYACVCGGAHLAGSASNNKVLWNGFSFTDILTNNFFAALHGLL